MDILVVLALLWSIPYSWMGSSAQSRPSLARKLV